jgi:dienelactone hydrolase
MSGRNRFGIVPGMAALVFSLCLGPYWGIGLSGAAPAPDSAPFLPSPLRLEALPGTALYGTPYSLRVTGLEQGERVTITARSTDHRGILWVSSAVFEASQSGVVDAGVQAPSSGDYSGVDIFGLLWSMKPVNPPPRGPGTFTEDPESGWTVDFSVIDSQGREASTRMRRTFELQERPLTRVPLKQDGLRGALYHPSRGGPFPGVLILAGSGGGIYEWLARAFASQGFAALTLAYFQYEDLPPELVEIPIEYFQKAAEWLRRRPEVRPDRIAVAGGSKGGELALLLASRFIDFQAVVAWTPAEHVWEGLSLKFLDPDYEPRSSWSFNGEPLPFIRFRPTPEERELEKTGRLESFVALHERSLDLAGRDALEKAAIPVERIKAPILLISGTHDQTWPADRFCESIVDELKDCRFNYEVRRLSHPGAGHMSFLPSLITAGRDGISGGNPRADSRAGFISWEETLNFLRRHLL